MKFVLIAAATVSTLLASNITLSPVDNNMGKFKKSDIKIEGDSLRISSRIVLKRGLENRHISVLTIDNSGNKLNNYCKDFYIPGDNHVHKGVSKNGRFSIAIPNDTSINEIRFEFANMQTCN